MKKAAIIVLLFLYTLSSFGIGLRQFYCCGKLKATSLNIIPSPKKTCSAGESDGCCNTKYKFFKVKDSHFGAQEINSPQNHVAEALSLLFPTRDLSFTNTQTRVANFAHAPPLPPCTPLYIIGNYYQKTPIIAADQPFSPYFDASLVWGPITGRMLYAGWR